MNKFSGVASAIALLIGSASSYGSPLPAVPDNPLRAQTFFGFNIRDRCPGLRLAEAGPQAVVVFWVPRRGPQAQASIKTSSGSAELDSAALNCVSKLRFVPSVTLGDGESIDSWQQIALGWVEPDKAARDGATSPPVRSPAAAGAARPPAAISPGQSTANAGQKRLTAQSTSVTVRACVDAKGKLVQAPAVLQSSGVADLDQAAVEIAEAGAAHYRPHPSPGGSPLPGCAKLSIEFDAQ